MKTFSFIVLIGLLSTMAYAQNVTFASPALKTALLNNPSVNLNLDGEIQLSEANAFSDSLILNTSGIYSLSGMEAFINLLYLEINFGYTIESRRGIAPLRSHKTVRETLASYGFSCSGH